MRVITRARSLLSPHRIAIPVALASAALLAGAPNALADYGPGAQYQVEISDNNVGGVPGNGVWLWIELNADGTGDYTGAICIHTGSTGMDGAESDMGDVTWSDTAGTLTISGIRLIHKTVPVVVTVPDGYGHYAVGSASVIKPDLTSNAPTQVQVAP